MTETGDIMTDKIRWGILATGAIAATFTRDLQTLPDTEVVAVGSRSQSSADRFAEQFGIRRSHGSWAALAADDEVDVIYVATPHSAHHDAAALCLEMGKPVLCEKAFTRNHAEAVALIDLARSRGVFLMEAMWMRTIPLVKRMAGLILDGAVGDVRLVNAAFGLEGPFPPEHRLRDPNLAGGALLDLGVYPVALAQLILGPPATISARAVLTPEGVDETTTMLFGYDEGAAATLSCSIAASTATTAVVSGTRGRIELAAPFFRPSGMSLHRQDSVETFAVPHRGHGMVHEAEEVMRCLREGKTESPLVPWDSTLDVMATLDEIRQQIGVRFPGE